MPPDPRVENIELSLIQADANDAVRLIHVLKYDPRPPAISFAVFPVIGLVAEESYDYFRKQDRAERLGSLDGELVRSFRHSLAKVRARIKLFDDTDRGGEELVSFMSLVRERSAVLFSHPTSKWIQRISRGVRPDLGVYFSGNHMIATTHAALPAFGFTTESLKAIRPGGFEDFKPFLFEFSRGMGEHLAILAKVLFLNDHPVTLDPGPAQLIPVPPVTHNDFVGDRVYRYLEESFQCTQPERVPALTLCLSQVNAALHLLPALLGENSNLLVRVQYLAAYHGSNALRASLAAPPPWLDHDPTDALSSRKLRNIMAHYELRGAARYALGAKAPFHAVIAGISRRSAEEIAISSRERLTRISECLGTNASKTSLKPLRALFGDHS